MSRRPGHTGRRPSQQDEAGYLLDLTGRIMFTHRLDPALAVHALGLSTREAKALVDGAPVVLPRSADWIERLRLFANVLVRLELRCRYDTRAIQRMLSTPIAALENVAPADHLNGIEALRAVRASLDTTAAPVERWYRVGH